MSRTGCRHRSGPRCSDRWPKDIRTFVDPSNPNRVGLSMDVADMDAFQAIMTSEAGAEAMKYDGVRPETLVVLVAS